METLSISFIIMAFVECGTCEGYPYRYNSQCLGSCPASTTNMGGYCVPNNCGIGFIRRADQMCVPVCGQNQTFSGKYCSCSDGFNLISGRCQRCSTGTTFNYKDLMC